MHKKNTGREKKDAGKKGRSLPFFEYENNIRKDRKGECSEKRIKTVEIFTYGCKKELLWHDERVTAKLIP